MNSDISRSLTMDAMRLFVTLVGLLWFGALARGGNDWYVATNGTGGGTSWANATNSIQDAICLCSSGDVVWVSNGVYATGGVTNYPTDTVLTNRVAITTAYITVRSANNDPTNTIIRGSQASDGNTNGLDAVRCVYLTNKSALIGFTLTNGATLASGVANDTYGGGAWCESTNATISNCIIVGNSAEIRSGGVYRGILYNSRLIGNCQLLSGSYFAGGAYGSVLFNCILTGNQAANGGGVYSCSFISNCTFAGNSANFANGGGANASTLYNCTMVNNYAKTRGGGAFGGTLSYCAIVSNRANYGGGTRESILYNCLIVSNYAGDLGGGTYLGTLYNCTVASNYANNGGGGVYQSTVYNSISWNNNQADYFVGGGATYYSCGVDYSGNNCITNNPQFVNHIGGNFRVKPNSPCVNTGTNQDWMTNSVDLDGRARIRYGTVDMGAYETLFEGTIFTVRGR